jgi:DNA-binding transcriptional regulator LsrR (DeoR family)
MSVSMEASMDMYERRANSHPHPWQLYAEGMSKNQIAQRLNIGRASVFRALSVSQNEPRGD